MKRELAGSEGRTRTARQQRRRPLINSAVAELQDHYMKADVSNDDLAGLSDWSTCCRLKGVRAPVASSVSPCLQPTLRRGPPSLRESPQPTFSPKPDCQTRTYDRGVAYPVMSLATSSTDATAFAFELCPLSITTGRYRPVRNSSRTTWEPGGSHMASKRDKDQLACLWEKEEGV